jgi:hypothetical protein
VIAWHQRLLGAGDHQERSGAVVAVDRHHSARRDPPPPHDTEVAGRVLRAGEELDGQASDVQNLIPDPAAMR